MKTKIIMAFLFALSILISASAQAQAQTPQETLNQYVSDLQNNPNDNALREKIIKHVQTMKPAPAIPEEARKHFIKAGILLKGAKDVQGYDLAVSGYKQALLIAPWWPEAYYNYAAALELAHRFDEEISAIKMYLLTNPSLSEARSAQDMIYAAEAKKELAANESANETSRKKDEAKKNELDVSGHWKQLSGSNCDEFFHFEFQLEGDQIVLDMVCDRTTKEADECGQPTREGFRLELFRLPRVSVNAFQGFDHIGNNLRLEFQGDTAIKTWLSDGNKKTYFKRK